MDTEWRSENMNIPMPSLLFYSCHVVTCDLLLSISMDDIAGYTLGAVWVEQYTVFWDVPYVVLKVTFSTLGNRYDNS